MMSVEIKSLRFVLRFLRYVAPFKMQIAACFFLIFLVTLTSLSVPIFSMLIIDRILIPKQSQLLNIIGIAVISIILVNGLAGFLRTVIFVRFKYGVLHVIRMELFRKIQSLSLEYFVTHQKGYILSRIHNDAGRLATLMSSLLFELSTNVLMLCAGVGIMFYFHARLTWMIVAIMPVFFLVLAIMARRLRDINTRLYEDHGVFQGKLQESIEGIRLTKALGTEAIEEKKYRHYLGRFFTTFKQLDLWASYSQLVKVFFSSSIIALILWYGSHQVISGRLTIGQLSAFGSLVGFVFAPLEMFYDLILNLQGSYAALTRVFEVLDLQARIKEVPNAIHIERARGCIEFQNVDFRYEKKGFALHNINFSVSSREKLGIVGRSGVGKTTLINLLLRFYDPRKGQVLLDGTPVRQLAFESLRRNIAVVLQDVFFFDGTIADAIKLGNQDAGREEIERAATLAQLHDRILQLPRGYDTVIGEGGIKMSAGERQRLSIARAILKDAPVLILDEATSSLDSESETAISLALKNLLAGKTTLVIAHRLSTLLQTDRVIFLDAGSIVAAGPPKEILDRNSEFRALFQAQLDCASQNFSATYRELRRVG